MSFLIYPHKFDAGHLHYGTSIQGDVSKFSRIIYSTPHISLNGVGVVIELVSAKHEQHYNKMFVSFDPRLAANQITVSQLRAIESDIVNKYAGSVSGTLQCIHSLSDQLNSGCIKSYINTNANVNDANDALLPSIKDADACAGTSPSSNSNKLMLKICGVWETKDECGITYKFIKC